MTEVARLEDWGVSIFNRISSRGYIDGDLTCEVVTVWLLRLRPQWKGDSWIFSAFWEAHMMLMLKMKKWSSDRLSPSQGSGNDSSPTVLTRTTDSEAPNTREVDENSLEDDVYTSGDDGHQGNLAPEREPDERSVAGDSNYDELPALDGKAIDHYQEARDRYPSTRPPFVSANRGQSGHQKLVVLATSDGKYPKLPQMVTLVTRSWNRSELYWILDLGKPTIVKGTAGGLHGATYRSWLGVDKGMSASSVAFSPRGFLKKAQPN